MKRQMLLGKDAVIFDLDGSLVDSMWIWRDIDIEYLGKFGIAIPEDLQSNLEGMSFTETAVYFKERFSLPDSLDEIKDTADFDACVAHLCRVKGIGLKVECCALLFGFDKTEAFPIDVWMKRVMEKYFPDGIDLAALGKTAGIAQQYLFYYERYNTDEA